MNVTPIHVFYQTYDVDPPRQGVIIYRRRGIKAPLYPIPVWIVRQAEKMAAAEIQTDIAKGEVEAVSAGGG